MLSKKDFKARLIKWIFLLQEFKIEIKDKKEVDNMTVDHLSKIVTKFQGDDKPINGDFLEDAPFIIEKLTWFAHIVNFIANRKMLEV